MTWGRAIGVTTTNPRSSRTVADTTWAFPSVWTASVASVPWRFANATETMTTTSTRLRIRIICFNDNPLSLSEITLIQLGNIGEYLAPPPSQRMAGCAPENTAVKTSKNPSIVPAHVARISTRLPSIVLRGNRVSFSQPHLVERGFVIVMVPSSSRSVSDS